MCKALRLPRSSFYYQATPAKTDTELENAVINEFKLSRRNYGTRKLKIQLSKKQNGHEQIKVSRRWIGKIMSKYGLVSKYTLRRSKNRLNNVNEDVIPNIVNREYSDRVHLEVVVSDLTYVKLNRCWHYICLLLDLHGRKIIGSAVGRKKDAQLVRTAFYGVQDDLRKINVFHTDRGSEFKNQIIDEIIKAFGITRSLSAKGTPVDNAVAESMYNIIKTEFIFGEDFANLDEFSLKWFDYVNWYNNVRIHGSLGYLTPNDYKNLSFSEISQDSQSPRQLSSDRLQPAWS
jgi:transposase InsO family protein